MAGKTTIEWATDSWNPVRGCSIVSKGCTNCYAMRQAHRHAGAGRPYDGLTKLTKGGPVWTGEIRTVPELLGQPGRWKRPRRIFVNSMSDLFHEDVPDEFIAQVWKRMAWNQQHVFQILTKRAARMRDWVSEHGQNAVFYGEQLEHEASLKAHGWPLRNVWLGVSVEDQAAADVRIPPLLQTSAAVHWISAEPLLGPVDISMPIRKLINDQATGEAAWRAGLTYAGTRIDWVVAGGESGPGARPMHPDWARSLRDQCAAAGVAFFFKQWGAWYECEAEVHADERGREACPITMRDGDRVEDETMIERMGERGFKVMAAHGTEFVRVGKKIAGRELDGRTHDEYPA